MSFLSHALPYPAASALYLLLLSVSSSRCPWAVFWFRASHFGIRCFCAQCPSACLLLHSTLPSSCRILASLLSFLLLDSAIHPPPFSFIPTDFPTDTSPAVSPSAVFHYHRARSSRHPGLLCFPCVCNLLVSASVSYLTGCSRDSLVSVLPSPIVCLNSVAFPVSSLSGPSSASVSPAVCFVLRE